MPDRPRTPGPGPARSLNRPERDSLFLTRQFWGNVRPSSGLRASGPSSQRLSWLAQAQSRLSEQERILSGRELPGVRKERRENSRAEGAGCPEGAGCDEVLVSAEAEDGAAEMNRKKGHNYLTVFVGWVDDGVSGRTQQFVFGDQAQGAGISLHRISDRDALLCRRQVGGPIP